MNAQPLTQDLSTASPTSPAAKRAVEYLRRQSKHSCLICGADKELLFVGSTDVLRRRFTTRCERHLDTKPKVRDTLATVFPDKLLEIMSIASEADKAAIPVPGCGIHFNDGSGASEDDRRWFEQRPRRTHRLRARFPDEPLDGDYVIVTQIRPGHRCRVAVAVSSELMETEIFSEHDEDPVADEILAEFARRIALAATKRDGQTIPISEVARTILERHRLTNDLPQ